MPATLTRSTSSMQSITERFAFDGPRRVDRVRGIVRDVKILGHTSRNGRSYPESTQRPAVPLYEGCKVNLNHPKGSPLSPRDYQDRFGVFRNVRYVPGDGMRGDLHYNPKHPVAEQFAWDAEHAPENCGFSHNIEARTGRSRGRGGVTVESIGRVVSVDLVADPATTGGIYESEGYPSGGNSDGSLRSPADVRNMLMGRGPVDHSGPAPRDTAFDVIRSLREGVGDGSNPVAMVPDAANDPTSPVGRPLGMSDTLRHTLTKILRDSIGADAKIRKLCEIVGCDPPENLNEPASTTESISQMLTGRRSPRTNLPQRSADLIGALRS